MDTWTDGWREAVLRAADIPVTQFALDVLNYWQQSTPTTRWTNNPLGMPAAGFSAPRALNTPYAAFPTLDAFYRAFTLATNSQIGQGVFTALATQDKLTVAWRAIHALQWPANLTETDYPTAILDAVTDGSTAALKVSSAEDRKTVGVTSTTPNPHAEIAQRNQALYHAVNNINNASDAIRHILGR